MRRRGHVSDEKWLNLSNQQLSQVPQNVKNMDEVQYFKFTDNYIETLPDFEVFRNAKDLLFARNEISIIKLSAVHNLNVLDLSHNKLKSIPDVVLNCHTLYRLDLSHNQISDIRIDQIEQILKIPFLDLSGNSQAIIRKIKAYLRLQDTFDHEDVLLKIDDNYKSPSHQDNTVISSVRFEIINHIRLRGFEGLVFDPWDRDYSGRILNEFFTNLKDGVPGFIKIKQEDAGFILQLMKDEQEDIDDQLSEFDQIITHLCSTYGLDQ